jgi:hypothetical protein
VLTAWLSPGLRHARIFADTAHLRHINLQSHSSLLLRMIAKRFVIAPASLPGRRP